MGLVNIVNAACQERRAAGEQVIEGPAQTIDIGSNIDAGGIDNLLGCDEVGGTEGLSLPGQALSSFSSLVALARPKSRILSLSLPALLDSIRLLGFTSRWTSPSSWACCNPRAA